MGTVDVVGGQASGDSGRLARPPAPRASQSHPAGDAASTDFNTDGAGRARRRIARAAARLAHPHPEQTGWALCPCVVCTGGLAPTGREYPLLGGPKKQSGCCGQRPTNDRRPKYAPPARPAKALPDQNVGRSARSSAAAPPTTGSWSDVASRSTVRVRSRFQREQVAVAFGLPITPNGNGIPTAGGGCAQYAEVISAPALSGRGRGFKPAVLPALPVGPQPPKLTRFLSSTARSPEGRSDG